MTLGEIRTKLAQEDLSKTIDKLDLMTERCADLQRELDDSLVLRVRLERELEDALTLSERRFDQYEQRSQEITELRAIKARVEQMKTELVNMTPAEIHSGSLVNALYRVLTGFHETETGVFFLNLQPTDAQRIAKRVSDFGKLLQFPTTPFSWEYVKLVFLGELNQLFFDVALGKEPIEEIFQKLTESMTPKPKIWQQRIASMKRKLGGSKKKK